MPCRHTETQTILLTPKERRGNAHTQRDAHPIPCPSTHALPHHQLPAAHSSSLGSPRVRRTGGCRAGSLPIRDVKPLNSETADLEATCGRIRFVSRSFGARVQSPRPESAVFLDPRVCLSSIRALETRPTGARWTLRPSSSCSPHLRPSLTPTIPTRYPPTPPFGDV